MREHLHIAINHSSGISTKDFENSYRKCAAELYSFFVNDTAIASDNSLSFIKIFLTYIIKSMKINDQIRYGKLE